MNATQQTINEFLAIIKQIRVATIDHITHIDNLESILENGLMSHGNSFQKVDISNQDVNARRNKIEPIYNRSIHNYVPLYFNPRNAMLYRNRNDFGNDNIVILGFSKNILLLENSIFTNGNAASNNTWFTNDINNLLLIDWNKVWSRSWCNNHINDESIKNTMMAEFLIYEHLGIENLEVIYCYTQNIKVQVQEKFPSLKVNICVNPSLFF